MIAVPHFFACSSYRPQRLKAPFVRNGSQFSLVVGIHFFIDLYISSCIFFFCPDNYDPSRLTGRKTPKCLSTYPRIDGLVNGPDGGAAVG